LGKVRQKNRDSSPTAQNNKQKTVLGPDGTSSIFSGINFEFRIIGKKEKLDSRWSLSRTLMRDGNDGLYVFPGLCNSLREDGKRFSLIRTL
jgi:hypothetical protein